MKFKRKTTDTKMESNTVSLENSTPNECADTSNTILLAHTHARTNITQNILYTRNIDKVQHSNVEFSIDISWIRTNTFCILEFFIFPERERESTQWMTFIQSYSVLIKSNLIRMECFFLFWFCTYAQCLFNSFMSTLLNVPITRSSII